ncbi:16S rRNA (guanine(966)-N(2))-methyltransferase RsmD [Nitrosophilus kaiyonis]|uniref:16S rRNA (guanine(966)-N(2))-methyltransferase RsmD n=1 Tax=Nitrosophilus kaiyonis TaxID=2930200 RepID=UPI0024929941|nr:16S rRNA (guanine(966)-N(2))-methyltransferase RsmD [Nitrosophilus kaiyonis]
MKQNLETRIIAGKYKGKKIKLPSLNVTRSSKNILKESLFNTLQYDIIDRNFVEVFAGSGSVGLEALSRGASHVYFIEIDRDSFDILTKNAKSLDFKKCTLIFGDAFEKIFDVIEDLKRKKEKAYFYFDPPFSIREGKEDIYDRVFETIKKIPKEVVHMIIIEHMTKMDMPESIGKYKLIKRKKFGKSSLSYYE